MAFLDSDEAGWATGIVLRVNASLLSPLPLTMLPY
jgi:hypothetical protein